MNPGAVSDRGFAAPMRLAVPISGLEFVFLGPSPWWRWNSYFRGSKRGEIGVRLSPAAEEIAISWPRITAFAESHRRRGLAAGKSAPGGCRR